MAHVKVKKMTPVIIDKPDRYFLPWITDARLYPVYKRQGFDYFLSRVKRKLRIFGHVPPLFHEWRHDLKRADQVVVMDSAIDEHLLERLLPHREQVILYMWNPVKTLRTMVPAAMDHFHQYTGYSHDRGDCQAYDLRFNTAFYHPMPTWRNIAKPTHDLVFVGANKNRGPLLATIFNQLGDMSLDFHIRDHQTPGQWLCEGLQLQDHDLSYEAYLQRVASSRGILEILQQGQDSLSLRPMESIFYQKKLITNYQGIVREDFYHPENILLFEDPRELTFPHVNDFLASPYKPVDPQILKRYEFKSWLARFEA